MESDNFFYGSSSIVHVKCALKKTKKFFRDNCIYENKSIYSHVETFNLNIIYS